MWQLLINVDMIPSNIGRRVFIKREKAEEARRVKDVARTIYADE